MNPLSERRYDLGRRLLGPIVAEYLIFLSGHIRFFVEEREAKPLFVARSGIRIRQALETFLSAAGLPFPNKADNFWISRLMVAKGTWRRNRDNAIGVLSQEFSSSDLRTFSEAMFRYEGVPKGLQLSDETFQQPADNLSAFFAGDSAAAKLIDSYFSQQSEFFEHYLEELLGVHEKVLLIDTGWAGTAQRLLADSFTEIEWWGAYFGRYGFAHTNRTYWRNMIGIAFEQDFYQFDKPETCTILNRHMIEDLFEPSGSSIERFALGDDGKIFAPEAVQLLADEPNEVSDPIFMGVLDYLTKLPDGAQPAALHKAARVAWHELSRLIALPSRDEAEIFSDITRSADFGRTNKVPLILPPLNRDDDDTAERRIKDALWQTGQTAMEYPSEVANPIQRKLAGLRRLDFKQPSPKRTAEISIPNRPAVAIVTRTLDRPWFLKRALESVSRQTFDDYVQVVVNDGGDISLAEHIIAETNCAHHKIILVDNVVNRGMEAASNIAIQAVDSDYIVIHDDDDSWEPTFLEKTVAFLETANPQIYGGVITQTNYVSEEVTPAGLKIHSSSPYQGWIKNVHIMEMAIQNFFPPISFLFRRDLYDKIGGFNQNYPVLGDWDFNLRFLIESDIGMIHEPLANYHHRDRGDTSLFGNSVISGRDQHIEYSSVVRNRFARNLLHADHPALAVLVGIGLHFDDNRREVREVLSRVNRIAEDTVKIPTLRAEPSSAPHGDDYWVALNHLNIAIASNDQKVLKEIGINAERGRKTFLTSTGTTKEHGELSWQAIQYLSRLKRKGYDIQIPPDFDDTRYLSANPDVAAAVGHGLFSSGFDHYYQHGRHEGRPRPARDILR